jgi:hypothetical protein
MASKADLRDWVMEAIDALGGGGTVVEVCREVWNRHESDLEMSGDLFFTWQYDIRWAAQDLRDQGRLMSASEAPRGVWALASHRSQGG